MGFQSAFNKTAGTIAAGVMGVSKTLQDRQKESMEKVKQQQVAKKTQRRNFMSYLQKQPIAGGGTVGELPIQAQKQIASQYTKTQRKQLMDTMDMESKK